MDLNSFFGYPVDLLSFHGKALALLLAVLIGGLIGFERQWNGNPAGLRTHILVCVGSTVITLTSVEIGLGTPGGMRGDPAHLAAQIVSGIGFLGAGAILREGMTVHGITTAASIWATAGMGIAVGASPHLAELAVLTAVIVLITLTLLSRLEARFMHRTPHSLRVEVRELEHSPALLLQLLAEHGITVYGVETQAGTGSLNNAGLGASRSMRIQVQLPRGFDRNRLNAQLMQLPGMVAFNLD